MRKIKLQNKKTRNCSNNCNKKMTNKTKYRERKCEQIYIVSFFEAGAL